MIRILFVCSGNVFRSMSAQYIFQDFLFNNKIKNISVDSAGILVNSKKIPKIVQEVKNYFLEKGIDVSKHVPKNVSEVDLNFYHLVVSMGYNHRKYLLVKYNCSSILFNKVCYNLNYPVYDNNEVLTHHRGFRGSIYNIEVVKKLFLDIPFFYKNFKQFI